MSSWENMDEREQLEQSIADLEAQRTILGDAVVEAALEPLRESLARIIAREGAIDNQPSERRIVTILFCDVTGSTALAEQMDPEEWTGIMNAAFKYLNESVVRYDGTVARLMGDAILAFFGAPVAHEDDPERAVLAGLDILEGIGPLREQLERERALDFNVRVGINTGLAVVGEVGSDIRGEYTAMGDAVNVAARMEQTAAPGTIQISEETYQHVASLFEVEKLGGVQVKGKSRPIQAYRVIQSKPGAVKKRGLDDIGLTSPLVGREDEMAAMRTAVQRLVEHGEGGLVLIFGEAGIGKSRLKDELGLTIGESVRWLEGSTLSFSQTLSYWPFQEILRDFADITDDDDETAAWFRLEQSITRLHSEKTDDILPYLASLLALEVREPYLERVQYLEAEDLGRQIYLTCLRFFEQLALEQPLMLVFEDLHWMDDASARLLEHLLALIERVPLLMLGLSRPEPGSIGERLAQIARQNYADRYTELRLTSLPAEASQAMVENLLMVADLPGQMRQSILSRAGGNPFFLEEIVRTLIEAGAVARDPGTSRWHATEAGMAMLLPDTIQGMLMARVDRLAEEEKGVLRTASVVGRSFLYRVLREVVETDDELNESLASLETADLIQEKQRMPELEYIFKHALAQEAVYESILLRTRRKLHQQVAQTIEFLFADRLEEFYGLLAYHYAQAEAWEEALDYLLKAGDMASQVAADGEALAHYHQALSAYERAFGEQWDPLQRAKLARKIGQALFRRGEHEQALENLKQALSLLDRPLPESTWGIRLGILAEAAKQIILRLLPGLLKKAGGLDEHPGEVECIAAYESIVWVDLVGKPKRFLLDTLRALNLAERINHPEHATFGYIFLGGGLVLVGRFGLAERYARYALDLTEKIDNPGVLADVHNILTVIASFQGQVERALEHGRIAAQLLRKAGSIRGWGNANLIVGETKVYTSQYAEAAQIADEVIKVGQDSGDLQVKAWGYGVRGLVERYTRAPEVAIESYRRAYELAAKVPDYIGQVDALVMIGHNYLLMDQVELALASLNEAEHLSRAHNVFGGRFESRICISFACAYLMGVEMAREGEQKPYLEKAIRACKEARRRVRSYRPYAAEAFRLQGSCDWLRGRTQQARQWWDKSLDMASEIGQPYEQAMTYWEIGLRLEDSTHLAKAKMLLNEIGARHSLLDMNP